MMRLVSPTTDLQDTVDCVRVGANFVVRAQGLEGVKSRDQANGDHRESK